MENKILIIEDEALIAMDIKLKLKSFGYENVRLVHKPEDAMTAIEDEMPDLCLMDINLNSDMDGIDLAGVINASYDIPLVFLTSYSDFNTMDRAKEVAPYGYLVKPIESQALYSMVLMALNRADLEKNLIEQNRLFESVLENSSDGIVVLDKDHKVKYFNHIFMSIFDIQSGDLFGETIEDVSGKLGKFDSYDFLKNIKEYGRYKTEVELNNGETKPVLITVSSFDLYHSTDVNLLFFTDLSELEQVREALSKSRQDFQEIFQKNKDAILVVDVEDLSVVDVNPAFESMFGITTSDIVGFSLSKYDFLQPLWCIENIKDRGSGTCRSSMLTASGEQAFVEISAQMMELGGKDCAYLSIRDVTEEAKLQEREQKLQQKLIHANKMTALGTLVSGVAHEINNPNNFIMFNSQILLDMWQSIRELLDDIYHTEGEFDIGGLPYSTTVDDIAKLLEGIVSGAERIKKIVHELKDFSKGDLEGYGEQVKLEEVIASSVKILKQHILKFTSNFSIDIGSEIPFIKGNRQKLEQIIINLVLNALESLESKASRVTVSCKSDGKSVVVKVKDEGKGMSDDVQKRVTEPFFTTRQKDGGTGLGLSIVYSFMKEHGGEIDIQSQLGKGTSVILTFPVV